MLQDHHVYLRWDDWDGAATYAGITEDLVKRNRQHLAKDLVPGFRYRSLTAAGPVTELEAHAIEQALIHIMHFGAIPSRVSKTAIRNNPLLFHNLVNGVSTSRGEAYSAGVTWGLRWLAKKGHLGENSFVAKAITTAWKQQAGI